MIGLYFKNIDGVWFGVACGEELVYASSFGRDRERVLRDLLSGIPFDMPFEMCLKDLAFADNCLFQIKDIYDGKGNVVKVSLAMRHLPAYTQRVLEAVAAIPVGYVTSYGGVAKAVGGGARAVGNVMAHNPFALIVPCHRVVASDFSLGGYGGGLYVKRKLLERERRGYRGALELPVEDGVMMLSPVEFVFGEKQGF